MNRTNKNQITVLWIFYFIMMGMGIWLGVLEEHLAGMFSFIAAIISQVNIRMIRRSSS